MKDDWYYERTNSAGFPFGDTTNTGFNKYSLYMQPGQNYASAQLFSAQGQKQRGRSGWLSC